MRRRGLVSLLAAGGLGASPAAAQPSAGCAPHEAGFAALVGRPEAEVRAALAAMPGIRLVRSGGPTSPMTMDYLHDRVTLLVQDGRVVRLTCG